MGNQQSTQSASFVDLPTKAPQGIKPAPSSFDPQHPTGDPTIDNGNRGPCTGVRTGGCYLNADQRGALVAGYQAHVNLVASQCTAAITEVKIVEQLKNTDESPWYVNLIMSAVAAVLTEGLSIGIAAGGAAAGRVLSGAARSANEVTPALAADVQKMFAVVSIEAPAAPASATSKVVAGKTVDAGNNALKPTTAHTVSSDSNETKQKIETLGFINYLNKVMVSAFKRLLDGPPSTLDDAELTALRNQFDPDLERNQTPAFVAKFTSAIREFQNSPVSKIGRRQAWDEKRGNERYELETRVAWLIAKGSGQRLIYIDRAFSAWFQRQQERTPQWAQTSRSPAYDSGHHQLSLQQDASWRGPLGDRTDHETPVGPDMMIKYVEPELKDLALQKQKDVWLAEPETFMMDYSYAPPKMIKVAGS